MSDEIVEVGPEDMVGVEEDFAWMIAYLLHVLKLHGVHEVKFDESWNESGDVTVNFVFDEDGSTTVRLKNA